MRRTRKFMVVFFMAAAGLLSGYAWAEPVAAPGYAVEAYVTGLQNVQSIAFSPGGDFGFEGQLFIGDSRPNGVIYRVPSKENKIYFATGAQNQLLSMAFAPTGSAFGPKLYVTHGYHMSAYSGDGSQTHFASINAFPWCIAFAPDELFRNNLFHADGWEPSGEAVREWMPDGTQTVLVYTEREETHGLAFGPGGAFGENLYVLFCYSERSGYPFSAISRVTPEGQMSTFVTLSDNYTHAMAFDVTGNFRGSLFVSDYVNSEILEVDSSGDFNTFASGFMFYEHSDHPWASGDIAFGPDGAMYVADSGAGVVWRIFAIVGELDSLEIAGPDEVAENSAAQYEATAYYTGGTVVDVTSRAEWSVEPDTYASIDDSGILTAEKIFEPQAVTITAEYTAGEITVEAEKDVHIFGICPDGTALEFDGLDDYVDLADGFADFTDGFTVALWAYPTHTGWHERFIDFGNGAGSDNIILTRVQTTNHLILSVWSGGSQGAWVYAREVLELNKWQHFAATVDNSGNALIYKNGSVVGSGRTAVARNITRVNNYIGKSNWGADAYYKGSMDDVRIYGRVLSEAEIKAAMHIPLEGGEPNLVGYWNFDEGEGQIVYDLSPNANHGRLGSAPDVDDSDPNWVDSDAPVGVCTPEGLVERNVNNALEIKLNILREIEEALLLEDASVNILSGLFREAEYGHLNKRDIIKAKQEIHSAIQSEEQAIHSLEKSVGDLEGSLEALVGEDGPPESNSVNENSRSERKTVRKALNLR